MLFENLNFGLLDQKKDARDFTAQTLGIEPGSIETTIELPLPDFVYNQGMTMMCTSFAATMMMSIINGTTVEFSQGDLYAQKPNEGEGATLRDVMNNLLKRGVAPKMLYNRVGTFEECKTEYDIHKEKADFMCELGRIRHYYEAKTEGDVVAALELGLPLMASVTIHQNFIPEEGVIPLPDGPLIGGHALLIVGHKPGYVKVLNSWGEEWGENGCAWMPFEMIDLSYVPVDANMKVKSIYFQIGLDYYVKNGQKYYMKGLDINGNEVPIVPFIKDGRTYIPVKFAADAFESETEWWPHNQVIYIKQ